jgi:glutathione-specific gamma-glutamylcyclotransferase
MWLFAYGSLIFRPGFLYRQRVRGYVSGFERRFWQRSTDHRGTPERPGRVVTLVPVADGRCWGVAYELLDVDFEGYVAALDHRESQGYERRVLPFVAQDRQFSGTYDATVYVAPPGNPHFHGEQSMAELSAVIRESVGPSGHNAEYVLNLADALSDLDITDPHVFELANWVSDPVSAEAASAETGQY